MLTSIHPTLKGTSDLHSRARKIAAKSAPLIKTLYGAEKSQVAETLISSLKLGIHKVKEILEN
jgi:hypothetical protein